MKTQHASLFSYNLTRPYPYWWFTPVTLVAAFALTAVFSYLNYAANGFELVVTTSSDPNGTIADLSALHGLPRLLTGKYRPNCQPVSLAAGSKFFTNSTGLKYEILKVSRQGSTDILPALTYSNNVLDHCMVTKVELEPSSQDRTANQWSVSAFGIIVRTYATCNISSSYGPITFDILNSYDLVPETATVNFVSQNKSARASLWWGESLLSTYWIWATFEISKNHTLPDGDSRPGSNNKISKAHLAFHPDDSSRDILDTTFMRLAWRMLWEGAGTERGIYWWEQEEQVVYASEYAKRDIWPSNWWLPAEKLAKSAYSTVLVDLGQAEWSNILLEDEKLQRYTADFTAAQQYVVNAARVGEVDPFDPASDRTGRLGTSPAVIATTYICNVPRRKATSTIAWSIIIADLVFLQAVWTVFKLVVEFYLFKRLPEAGHCAGCQRVIVSDGSRDDQGQQERSEDHEMAPLTKNYLRPGYQRQLTEDSRI